jgi:urease accessory protein
VGSRAPLQLLAPRVAGDVGWLVMGSLGGGLLEGDHIRMELVVRPGAWGYVTTQASTKVYKSGTGGCARQNLAAHIGPRAALILAPDPVVCFAESDYRQEQNFYLHDQGSLLAVDWFTSGRWLRAERWKFKRYFNRQGFYLNDRPVLIDCMDLDSSVRRVSSAIGMNRINALATVVCLGPLFAHCANALLQRQREIPIQPGGNIMFGASKLADGFVLRAAGDSAENLGRFLQVELVEAAAAMGTRLWSRKW